MKYFSADLHLGHTNILKYCARPFADVDAMDTMITNNFAGVLKPEDDLYLLGDLSFNAWRVEKFFKQVQGKKYWIFGNHDPKNQERQQLVDKYCEWAGDYKEIGLDQGIKAVLCHYPFATWRASHHGSWNLHGHAHGKLEPVNGAPRTSRRVDVGVDVWNFMPVSETLLRREMDLVASP